MTARWTISRTYQGPPTGPRESAALTVTTGSYIWTYCADLPNLVDAWKRLPDDASLVDLAKRIGGSEGVFLLKLASDRGFDDATMMTRNHEDIEAFDRWMAEQETAATD